MIIPDSVLDERGAVGILIRLFESDSSPYITDFDTIIPNPQSRTRVIERMADDMLVTLTSDPLRPVRRTVSLTEKGKRVAEHLRLAKAELESD
ncbi:hypothetical protein A3207_00655 [Candidatus Methanomassiliicoccus intestinalis]|nr:hypothetical protein [Candidatus Methanomassiliicoccus intestinalis]TQS84586.1 MAG: hypothetical protein A3207_00655 [Candidatus Methanomassiliicoccus intestinalis]